MCQRRRLDRDQHHVAGALTVTADSDMVIDKSMKLKAIKAAVIALQQLVMEDET